MTHQSRMPLLSVTNLEALDSRKVNVKIAAKACINALLLFQTAVAFKRSDLQRL